MYIPSHDCRKTGHSGNSFVFRIAVAVCLQHYRGTFDVFFEPFDRTDILNIICLQESRRIQSFILGWIQNLSKPGIYASSKISAGPQKKNQPDRCDRFENLFAVHDQQAEDHICHHHSKHDIRLISQLEHGVRTGISVLINITDINQFRDRHKSDRTQSHNYRKQVRRADCFHQPVQRFMLQSFEFLHDQRNYKYKRQNCRKSPQDQKLVWKGVILCQSHALHHCCKL